MQSQSLDRSSTLFRSFESRVVPIPVVACRSDNVSQYDDFPKSRTTFAMSFISDGLCISLGFKQIGVGIPPSHTLSHEQLSTNLLDSLDDHNYRDKGQDDTTQTKM